MQKQPSQIILYARPSKEHGKSYYADVRGRFGGGYYGAHAGDTAEEAALFALREKGRYIDTNPIGGSMHLPVEVREAIKATEL